VEDYTPLVFVSVLYVIAAFRYIHGIGKLSLPVGAVLFAVGLHVQGSLLIPSLALLIAWRYLVTSARVPLRRVTVGLTVLFAISVYVAGVHTGLRQHFLPLLPSQDGLAVVSKAHLVDILNEFFIVMPSGALFILLALLGLRSSPKAESYKTSESDKWMTLEIEWHFSWMVLMPCLAYIVFLDPRIGLSRDWDLFSVILLGAVPLALIGFRRTLRIVPARKIMPPVSTAAMALSAVLVIAWIGINASPTRSVARVKRTLEYDSSRAEYIYESLSVHYEGLGDMADAIDCLERSVAIERSPRRIFNLAILYKEAGRVEDSNRAMSRVLELDPRFPRARTLLLSSLFNARRCDEVVDVARGGTEIDDQNPAYYYCLGWCLIALGETEEGAAMLRVARGLKPPTWMLKDIKTVLNKMEREQQ